MALFSYIDRDGKPLVKFRRVKDFSELKLMEQEARNNAVIAEPNNPDNAS